MSKLPKFEFALTKDGKKMYENAQLPVYASKTAVCCDFFCAAEVTIPPMSERVKPTYVHTGIKADFPSDMALHLYTRSSIPKLGLSLANSVGIIESDYYGNESNDGELIFAYKNESTQPVTFKVGERIGQGEFVHIIRAVEGVTYLDNTRAGGFGSTGK